MEGNRSTKARGYIIEGEPQRGFDLEDSDLLLLFQLLKLRL